MARRMGPQDSVTSNVILDGAERVLQTAGYGAITSRSIADAAGVKQQLIYYYFETVDDILLAAFKRRTARGIQRLKDDMQSDKPIRAMWNDFSNAMDARLTFEYMALANHHSGIRYEVSKFMKGTRRIQIDVVKRIYAQKGLDTKVLPPEAIVFLISSIAMLLASETGHGITIAHKEIKAVVERFLQHVEQ